jgi:hypothetical protein
VLLIEKELGERFPSEAKYGFENRNGVLIKQYSEAYAIEYDRLLRGMVERRMQQSIYAVASFWYTAWLNAGQPDCSKMAGMTEAKETSSELTELNRKWREGKIKGKDCD